MQECDDLLGRELVQVQVQLSGYGRGNSGLRLPLVAVARVPFPHGRHMVQDLCEHDLHRLVAVPFVEVALVVRAVEVPAGLLLGGGEDGAGGRDEARQDGASRGVAPGFLQARMQEGDQLVHAVTFGLALCLFVSPQDLGDLLATAEEIDALNVALRAADRAGGQGLAARYFARLHEHVADVLQMPAQLLDLPEDVRGVEPARAGALPVVPVR